MAMGMNPDQLDDFESKEYDWMDDANLDPTDDFDGTFVSYDRQSGRVSDFKSALMEESATDSDAAIIAFTGGGEDSSIFLTA